MTQQFTIILLVLVTVNSLMPLPTNMEKGDQSVKIQNICKTQIQSFDSNLALPEHITELIEIYHQKITSLGGCSIQNKQTEIRFLQQQIIDGEYPQSLRVQFEIGNLEQLFFTETTSQEAYKLTIDQSLNVNIQAPNHWALARALDTLHQLIEIDGQIHNLPLTIEDEPAFIHRAVMVDTARHYLPVKTLERTIDALLLNKMNVLHWHITDDESFPLLLSNYSQITNTSKFWDTAIYTASDVKHIIAYASIRAVAIVPEIDSPAHTWSWSKSPELESITLTCGSKIRQYGQLDPTMDLTYTVLTSIMKEFYELFKTSPYVHFGGDETISSCYDTRPSIKEFMNSHNIKDYIELQTYYRQQQKAIWKNIVKSGQSVAYWYNAADTLPAETDDIIHWWGLTADLSLVADRVNRVILSDYAPLYIDTGVGNAFGNAYQTYHTWKEIYKWSPTPPQNFKGTIIGGEAPLWGETNNEHTHFMKLFIRSSVLADILWNPKTKETEIYSDFVTRLIGMEDRLINNGFGVSPVTHDYCKRHVAYCFPTLNSEDESDL